MFFVLLSSTVLIVALRQFDLELSGYSRTIVDDQSLYVLKTTVAAHLRFLNALSGGETRFDVDLITALRDLLVSIDGGHRHDEGSDGVSSLCIISHYRWSGQGTGITKMTEAAARKNWCNASVPWERDMQLAQVAARDVDQRRAAILALCHPDARICSPGCFDLNIRYLPQPTGSGEGLLKPPTITSGLNLDANDNQSLRRRK